MPTSPKHGAAGRHGLMARLDELDKKLPSLKTQYPDMDDFWNAFAGESDFATECAGSDDYDWVNERVDELLRKHGIAVPGDSSPVDG